MNKKLTIAFAVVMALAMVVPLAAIDNGDVSSAVPEPDPETDYMDIIMAIGTMLVSDDALPATDLPVHEDIVVEDGKMLVLDKNFIFDEGKKITVEKKAFLVIYPMQSYGFSTVSGFAGLEMEKGSKVVVVNDKPTDVAGLKDITIFENEMDTDEGIFFSGSMTYSIAKEGSIEFSKSSTLTIELGVLISK